MITYEIAITLKSGQTLYHVSKKNADGKSAMRCRVTGKVQTWRTRPGEFKIPVKRGLRDTGYITHDFNAADWSTEEVK